MTAPAVSRSTAGPLELLMLSSLPCGCVAADYRASSLHVDFIALEARGPLCPKVEHRVGQIIRFREILEDARPQQR